MKILAVLLLLVSASMAEAGVRYFTYSGPFLKLRIAVEDPHTTQSQPRILSLGVKYTPVMALRWLGRLPVDLDEGNIREIRYSGWSPMEVTYATWTGMGGGTSSTAQEFDPFYTIEILTSSDTIHKIPITFSKQFPNELPSFNVYTDRAALTLFNPKLKEVTAQVFNCELMLEFESKVPAS